MQRTATFQSGYLLHSRSYRETSLLLDIFTANHGRVQLIARGARGAKSKWRGLLQPFNPLLATWVGRSDLMTLTGLECNNVPFFLEGEYLLSGLYLNELLTRLLHRYDPHPTLFENYGHTLKEMEDSQPIQPTLRMFEKQLLVDIGYGPHLDTDAGTGEPIEAGRHYNFDPSVGFTESATTSMSRATFKGESLLAFHNGELNDKDHLTAAKRIIRLALHPLLNNKPIKSRELFL